jgi:hypothetical protein
MSTKAERRKLREQAKEQPEATQETQALPPEEVKPGTTIEPPKEEVKTAKIVVPEGMIAVKQEKLDYILNTLAENQSELNTLRAAVGEGKFQVNRKRDNIIPKIYLKAVQDAEGKRHLITGWKSSPDNKMIYSPTNPGTPIGEVVQAKYISQDGFETDWIDQVLFTRMSDYVYADVLEDDSATGLLKIKIVDDKDFAGQILEVHKTFVNP